LQNRLDPGLVGWRSHKDIYSLGAERVDYAQTARRFEFSTMAYGCALGLTESIRYLQAIGIDRIRRHNLELADLLLERLRLMGAQIVSPTTGAERTSIISARFPGREQKAVVGCLGAERIVVSPRRDFVRMSLHLYNTRSDVERTADVLQGLMR
jgi:cysteine desulfurase / selenocysteine lyase